MLLLRVCWGSYKWVVVEVGTRDSGASVWDYEEGFQSGLFAGEGRF